MDNNTKQNIYLVCKESEGIPDIDAIKQDELRVFNTLEAADEFAKFQRNTYVCNPNFADFTYMPEESKEGENYACRQNKRKRFLCVWKRSSKKPTGRALRMPLKSC